MSEGVSSDYGLGSDSVLSGFLDNALDGVVVADWNGRICGWNEAATDIFGWPPAHALGSSLTLIIPEGMHEAHAAGFARYRATRQPRILNRHLELQGQHRDGHLFPIELTVTAVQTDGPAAFAAYVRDLTEHHRVRTHLDELAHLDALTELPNRRGLARVLISLAEQSQRVVAQTVCILIDCDDFKDVNGQLGHAGGDVVLRDVARRIRGALRPADIVGRIGGDEFLAVLPETRMAEGTLIAERLRLAVSSVPIADIPISISAGVFAAPPSVSSLDELLALATDRLQHSKLAGKDRVTADKDGRIELSTTLTDLVGGRLHAHQQPLVQLGTRQVTGHEMLIRGPEGPFRNPNDFFNAARSVGQAITADLAALRTCLSAVQALPVSGAFHVNIFPTTLLATPLPSIVAMIPPSRTPQDYCIELSEQQLVGDPSYLVKQVAALKEAGFRFAIDDVGFGRSNFEALVILEPDLAKIDRTLVSGIDTNAAQRRTVERLLRALNALHIDVLPEGVETEGEAHVLADMGFTIGQGYLFGRPSPVNAEES